MPVKRIFHDPIKHQTAIRMLGEHKPVADIIAVVRLSRTTIFKIKEKHWPELILKAEPKVIPDTDFFEW